MFSAVGWHPHRDVAFMSTRVDDGGWLLLPRQSTAQQLDGDEIEDRVEVGGHGAG